MVREAVASKVFEVVVSLVFIGFVSLVFVFVLSLVGPVRRSPYGLGLCSCCEPGSGGFVSS